MAVPAARPRVAPSQGLRSQLDGALDEPLTTDADHFARLTHEADDAAATGDLATAEARLTDALALWRGEALEDVQDTPYLQAEARRLTGLRLTALEDRCDLAIRQGRHRELVDEVRRLVDRYPTRERLWALLMTALYGAGRRDEAVSTYAEARATLADELGIEPGAALQQLQAGMLRNDPELGGDPALVQPRRRARIPTLTSSTFGRDELTAEVADLLLRDDVRLVSLTGIGGSGKSRVATLVATAVEDRFADVVFLQVTEAIGSAQLGLEVALALEVDTKLDLADALDALGPEWRGLVVLDNLEALEEGDRVVRRLLDASARLTVLVTSRLLLQLAGEREQPVPPLTVPAIADAPATIATASSVQLFTDRATSAEPTFELAGQERDVAEICALLDGLPLAIELAAARVKLLSLDRIIDGVRTNLDLLSTGATSIPERQRAMATAIRWSYDRLLGRRAAGVRPAGAVRARLHHRGGRGRLPRRPRRGRRARLDRRRAAGPRDAEPDRGAVRGARDGPRLRPPATGRARRRDAEPRPAGGVPHRPAPATRAPVCTAPTGPSCRPSSTTTPPTSPAPCGGRSTSAAAPSAVDLLLASLECWVSRRPLPRGPGPDATGARSGPGPGPGGRHGCWRRRRCSPTSSATTTRRAASGTRPSSSPSGTATGPRRRRPAPSWVPSWCWRATWPTASGWPRPGPARPRPSACTRWPGRPSPCSRWAGP